MYVRAPSSLGMQRPFSIAVRDEMNTKNRPFCIILEANFFDTGVFKIAFKFSKRKMRYHALVQQLRYSNVRAMQRLKHGKQI